MAWLCHRYHDLATYASESLKQRIHFLAKPDGSNLQDLFIWDPPSSSFATSSSTASSWSSAAQIQEFIQRHWSADQLPLHPPHPYSSWDTVPVYCKELDQETLHAIVPIAQQDHAIMAVVLAVEGHHAPEGDKATCWRYHNMIVIQESELQSSRGWHPFSEFLTLKDPQTSNDSLAVADQEQPHGSETANDGDEDDDSDDDYWGQYSDSEDVDPTEDATNATTGAKSAIVKEGDKGNGRHDKDEDEDEDKDEDEYWRKYAEQQEQQDRDERKKKMQDPSAHTSPRSISARDHEDLLSSLVHPPTSQGSTTTIDSTTTAASSSIPSTLPGQLDPTMLSSLMQMLVAHGMDQPPPSQSSLTPPPPPPPPPPSSIMQSSSTSHVSPPNSDPSSKSRIMDSLRSIVQDCHRAGFSKDEVFEMLQSVYNTSHRFAE
ncbi:hypothetical protein EC968_010398 [Mortierella alpina]|nr:hypothetical protein EC968_010398 [Mortierella alpina]